MARTPHGSIAISIMSGRLRLQFPRAWYGGKQKYLNLRLPDTNDNRLHASLLARDIQWAYLQGKFDPTLAAYKPKTHQIAIPAQLTISEIWKEYCRYKSRSLKPSSIHYLVNAIGRHIINCPHQQISESLEIRGWLLGRTTPDLTRRVIQSLATAVKWALKHQLVTGLNPFLEMAGDIRVDRKDPVPNAFSDLEKKLVLEAFDRHPHYRFYAPLVKFWFLCGCRPSEGIGLQWEQLTDDCSRICFDRSITYLAGKISHNKKSKTNRSRWFPCQDELQRFLIDRRNRKQHRSLVFPSLHGNPIDYNNFSHRAWDRIVDTIVQRNSTPYSCRDTFITEQISKGAPIAMIAKWVDNSVEIIEKYYLDVSAIDHIKPL
jgi:integrase